MGTTKDRSVYKTLGWCGFGAGTNAGIVDVKEGKIARIRPMRIDEKYSVDDIKPWTIHARGSSFTPGLKTTLPPLAYGYKQRVYSPNRVPYPLKRVDWDPQGERHPETRGISGYERISWDEAAQICADEIARVIDTYGCSAVFCQGDGHGETKIIGGGHGCNTRLMDVLGGYTCQARQPDSWEGWYWGAKHVWGMDPVGKQTLQNNVLRDVSQNSDAVLFWGCDPETTPWGWGGQIASQICYWWTDLGIKSIYVCPDLNYGAAVHADTWIPVLPNTDAALQLAIAYVWMTEGLYDRSYIDTHAVGFDWFEYYVLGREDGVPKTPKWAEEKCGVPSRRIKALARYWAQHNVSIAHCNGGGYIRSCFSHEPGRLEVCLLAMQAVGAPGRNQISMIEWGLYGQQNLLTCPRPAGGTYFGAAFTGHLPGTGLRWSIPQTMVPDAILLPEGEELTWYGHVIAGLPRIDQFGQHRYPEPGASRIHMFWTDTPCWSTCWNGGNRMQDALRDPSIEFMLVQHPWMENDTLFADIILPVSTKLEQTDIATCTMCGHNDLAIHEEQAVDPVGEARTDAECVLAIAEKLGVAELLVGTWLGSMSVDEARAQLPEQFAAHTLTDEEKVAAFEELKRVGFMGGNPNLAKGDGPRSKQLSAMKGGMSQYLPFEKFVEVGYYPFPTADDWEDDPAGLIQFHDDPEGHPLDTPTGKIEFYATGIAEHWPGDEERPPVPHWIEESEAHHERLTCDRGKDYPFLVVSNHPRWRVHAEHDDIAWLRELNACKVIGPDGYRYEPVWVNPVDARARNLHDGDIVRIFNERGNVLGGVVVTERIMPHCISQDHGARVDSIVTGTGGLDRGGANNLICPGATTSKNAPGEVTNGFLANIEKVDVQALAAQYPEEFNRDYDPAVGLIASARIVKEA
ncbi:MULTISPECIES: molybdopterin-dependent oxidoreductase [Gordonibacter]|uniref:Molybdopterin-dependent oxidoreductase n=1 Tax=Gordonibacter faecis TaxID=3047475 RepID=A0ABT7DLB8_9ACTN|nr:molybdopterin-dependent oxidoreductase [Gordonibacter sp. KGMB12511]MDJ1650334.1 molybdopterin-dependent oxidoreductase [Gordonibacter sp. KGMB12511]